MSDQPSNSNKVVCVTGATGYIGIYVVRAFLSHGYNVRATVRDLKATKKLAPLVSLEPSGKSLQLVRLDLLDESTFRPALSNCNALIHTATPIAHHDKGWCAYTSKNDAYDRQIRPAVEGTDALLRAAAAEGIQDVVLTSSRAAMWDTNKDGVLDESCWTNVELDNVDWIQDQGAAYRVAKTLQEKTGWKLHQELGFRLVCINPTFVFGPSLTEHCNVGQQLLIDLAKGNSNMYYKDGGRVGIVDVRDVAEAHVKGLEKGEGRYFLKTGDIGWNDVLSTLISTDKRFATSTTHESQHTQAEQKFDNRKMVKLLDGDIISWNDSIRSTGLSIVEFGHWICDIATSES